MAAFSITSDVTEVDTTQFGRKILLIQNLGPGVMYMDSTDAVSVSEGFEMAVGGVYETASPSASTSIFLVSDSTSEARIVGI